MNRILMTGCSRSVGQYIADELREQGHQVFGVGLGGPDFELDFSYNYTQLEEVVREVFDKAAVDLNGPVDILIHNAAITHIDFMENHTLDDFDDVMNVNLKMPFALTREFVRRVIDEGTLNMRRVISTSSMGTKTSLRASPGYCASKAGIEALTKMWAREFSNKLPIITAAIAPAGIDGTSMKLQCVEELQRTRGMSLNEAEAYFAQSPLGRNCTFDEVWKLFDFCVNDMPIYCSGNIFYMTGGTGL